MATPVWFASTGPAEWVARSDSSSWHTAWRQPLRLDNDLDVVIDGWGRLSDCEGELLLSASNSVVRSAKIGTLSLRERPQSSASSFVLRALVPLTFFKPPHLTDSAHEVKVELAGLEMATDSRGPFLTQRLVDLLEWEITSLAIRTYDPTLPTDRRTRPHA